MFLLRKKSQQSPNVVISDAHIAIVGLPFIMVHWIYIHIDRGVILGFEPRHEQFLQHCFDASGTMIDIVALG